MTAKVWTADRLAAAANGTWAIKPPADWTTPSICSMFKDFQSGQAILIRQPKGAAGIDISNVPKLLARAAAVICRKDTPDLGDTPRLVVDNADVAIKNIARFIRKDFKGKVIGVVGTSGKTSTTYLLAEVLGSKYRVGQSTHSFNIPVAVAWNIAAMPLDAEYWVLEMAAGYKVAPTSESSDIAHPHAAIVTNVGPAHLSHWGTIENLAKIKSGIFEGMSEGGLAVIYRETNCFDIFKSAAEKKGLRIITFGEGEDADYRLLEYTDHSMSYAINGQPQEELAIESAGRHNCFNALSAMAVLDGFGLNVEEFLPAIGSFVPPDGRGAALKLPLPNGKSGTFKLIDSSYNANPISMRAAFNEFKLKKKPEDHDVLILGSMLELGSESEKYHVELADDILRLQPDRVLLCGAEMKALWDKLSDKINGMWCPTAEDLIKEVPAWIRADDRVLVKGSSGSNLWRVVRFLKTKAPSALPLPSRPPLIIDANAHEPLENKADENIPKARFNVREFLPAGISQKYNGVMPVSLLHPIACGGRLYIDAARSWNAMVDAADRDGVFLNVNDAFRAYRNWETQLKFFGARFVEIDADKSVDADKITAHFGGRRWQLKDGAAPVAIPGTSSHGYGLAVDIFNAAAADTNPWLVRNAKSFGFVREYDAEPWHFTYIGSRQPVSERVLEFENRPPEFQWSASQIAAYTGCSWLNNPPSGWRCGRLSYKPPFRINSLVVVDQDTGIGFDAKFIARVFRQCAGIICTDPADLTKYNRPLLIARDIKDTVTRLEYLFA